MTVPFHESSNVSSTEQSSTATKRLASKVVPVSQQQPQSDSDDDMAGTVDDRDDSSVSGSRADAGVTSKGKGRAARTPHSAADTDEDEDEDEGEEEGLVVESQTNTDDMDVDGESSRSSKSDKRSAGRADGRDNDQDEQEEEEEQLHANAQGVPPEELQRRIKARYRQLGYNASEQQSSINDVSVKDIGETIKQANKLFSKVTTTAEAVLDSHVLLAASGAAALKARNLKIDANALDTIEFLNRLVRFMGGRGSMARIQAANAPMEKGLKWGRVGRAVAAESRRVPVCDFMLGPLEIQVKEKKARVQRQRQKVTEADRVRPEELKAEDVQKDKHETGKLVKQLSAVLTQQGAEGIPYLRFVINPKSFAQTVENVFYFSFLVRENKACIELDDDPDSQFYQDYICYSIEPQAEDEEVDESKTQLVFEVTQQLWKDAIDVYGITESVIPHRDPYEAPGTQANGRRTKW
ncbi:hypothetical protein ACM66B_004427 [Microbotryomycetes sp. NB124-2]